MISLLVWIRDKTMLWKSYLARSAGYVALFNAAMLIFLSLSSLENYGIDIDLAKWGFLIVAGGSFIAIFAGYLEDKFGFWREETAVAQRRNHYFMEMYEDVKEMKKEISLLRREKDK